MKRARNVTSTLLGFSFALCAGVAHARDPVTLSLREVAHPVAVAPGGAIVLRGVVRAVQDGAAIDTMTTTTGEGESAATVPGGLYDVDAGGWRLVSRDLRTHTYRLAATGVPGSSCVEAGVSSPCLPLRMLPLAQSRLVSVAEFAAGLSGQVTLEVLDPSDVPLAQRVDLHAVAMEGGAGAAVLLAAMAGWRVHRRRRQQIATPEARVMASAARLRTLLRGSDPVFQRIAPGVEDLAARARALAALRDTLRRRVATADVQKLEARRAELAERTEPEAEEARTLLDAQLARIAQWRTEAERTDARITRIAEHLALLTLRLSEPNGTSDVADTRALEDLRHDVDAALEGARDAEAIGGP